MQGDDDAVNVPYSVLDMLYASPAIEAIASQEKAKTLFGEEWQPQGLSGLEEEFANIENTFNFSLFVLSQPHEDHFKLYEEYGTHLRQRQKELNHHIGHTHKLMNHLYQQVCYLYFNNDLNQENTSIAWELTAYITNLEESYRTHGLLESIIAMHEVKADTYKMIGAAEGRMDVLEMGLEEIKKAQALKELYPAIRNIKGMLFQYMAALSDTDNDIEENINKSLYQFEQALTTEFNQDYIYNYLKSFQLVEGFDLREKEGYYQREKRFLGDLQKKYPNVEIEFLDDEDEEYED